MLCGLARVLALGLLALGLLALGGRLARVLRLLDSAAVAVAFVPPRDRKATTPTNTTATTTTIRATIDPLRIPHPFAE